MGLPAGTGALAGRGRSGAAAVAARMTIGNLRGKLLGSRPTRQIGGGRRRTRAARQRRRYRPQADEDGGWAKKDGGVVGMAP
jgi:hypothetical protein